jgi:hypothetical protein
MPPRQVEGGLLDRRRPRRARSSAVVADILLSPYLPISHRTRVGPWQLVPFGPLDESGIVPDDLAQPVARLVAAYHLLGCGQAMGAAAVPQRRPQVPVELWEHEGHHQLDHIHDRLIWTLRIVVAEQTGDPVLRLTKTNPTLHTAAQEAAAYLREASGVGRQVVRLSQRD